MKFKPWAGQIGFSVATFFGKELCRNDANIAPFNSLHALAYYSKYNERFGLIKKKKNVGPASKEKLNLPKMRAWLVIHVFLRVVLQTNWNQHKTS